MSGRQIILRGAAMVIMFGGVGVYAAQSGLVPGIGNAQTVPAPVTAASLPPVAAPAALPATPVAATPDMVPMAPATPAISDSADIMLPRQAPVPVTPPAAAELPVPVLPTDERDPETSAFGLPCDVSVTVSAMPAAVVALDVMAPCQPDARIEVDHAGMMITGQTDAMGLMTLDIPAFESPAFFSIRLPDGTADVALVGVPDLTDYDRVAVQWTGDSQLELHAMELGAAFGDPGHVWEQAPGEMADALTGTGGFMVEIGSPDVTDPRIAQIYTFPRSTLGTGDSVRFSVDAPITEGNCGQPVSASTFEIAPAGDIRVTPIRMTMPTCDTVGDYLVLQNILRDLRLAAN
jgi:hypothetical protein